jgi:hypothetical protein
MRINSPAIPTAILVAISAALSACGDDASADTLTKAEFVDQANALCASEGQAIGEVIGPLLGSDQPSADDQQAALDQIVDLSHDIDALAAPSALKDDVDQLTAALDDGTDAASAQTGREFFSSNSDPWADAVAKAREMGLDACASEDG